MMEEPSNDEELFNPQEIDFSEVERLRTKVATLESLLTDQAGPNQLASHTLLKCYMDSQEASRRELAQAN